MNKDLNEDSEEDLERDDDDFEEVRFEFIIYNLRLKLWKGSK